MTADHVMETDHIPSELAEKLEGSQITQSSLSQGLSLHSLIAETTHCSAIKANERRQVLCLQTPFGEYFLKLSTFIRTKDRIRHTLLPLRRGAEWRNLHRLRVKKVAAATPVFKGCKKGQFFFILTQKVYGTHMAYESATEAEAIGYYVGLLHDKGVYHADLHPENIIVRDDGHPCLIDAQEVFFLSCMPRKMRIHNLGKIFHNLRQSEIGDDWTETFLDAYNNGRKRPVTLADVVRSSQYHRRRHYASRAKRCCKNSSEFAVIKEKGIRGYRRRGFSWRWSQLQEALDKGQRIKQDRVLRFQDVCIKIHRKRLLHEDRCLKAWKMSRALEVRGIPVPKALAYFRVGNVRYFLSEFLIDGIRLNTYISSRQDEQPKRQSLKELALWLRKIHETCVWQRDLKSNNVLYANRQYVLLDLDSVSINRRLSHKSRIVNLAQLNASLSNALTLRDRLRFYQYYRAREVSRQQRRMLYKKIMELTEAKDTEPFGLDKTRLLCRL